MLLAATVMAQDEYPPLPDSWESEIVVISYWEDKNLREDGNGYS